MDRGLMSTPARRNRPVQLFGASLAKSATVAVLVSLSLATGQSHNKLPPPRAILSIIIDDMGWHDAQPHNSGSPTPTLGALAAQGILLERHYTYT